MMGRYRDTRASFRIEFQPDDLFRGEHPVLLLDCSGRAGVANQQEEIVVHHMANHAGGISAIHSDMAWVIPPMDLAAGPATVYPRFEDDYIETAYNNDSEGIQWLYELIYYQTRANGAGYKLPGAVSILGSEIENRGPNKEAYRHFFQIKSQHAQDDYRGLIAFAEMMSLPADPIQEAQSRLMMMSINGCACLHMCLSWVRATSTVSGTQVLG